MAGRFYIHVQEKFFYGLSHLHRLETTPFFTRGKPKGREKGNVGMQLEQTTNVMRNALVIYFTSDNYTTQGYI